MNSHLGSTTPYTNTIGGSTNISQTEINYPQLTTAERTKLLNNVNFYNNEKITVGAFTNNLNRNF